jgi:hypothetical protein
MSSKSARLPVGGQGKITIVCTSEQADYIKECGCIACDDDICDCAFCDRCAYSPENVEFKVMNNSVFKESSTLFNNNEKQFIDILEDAMRYVKGELELDCIDGEWFAMDYREDLEGAFPIEVSPYDKPIITDEEAEEKHINIIRCCDNRNVSYVE